MGCDGGTIPRRDELVKLKKKKEKVGRDFEDAAKWKTCALTQNKLTKPIVTCPYGKLFNKESVIEAMLNKTLAKNTDHIKSMKDVKELNLTENPAFIDETQADGEFHDLNVSQFICPVVGVEMNGKHKFVVYWQCGCVVSEKALKEVSSKTCHKCGANYNMQDILILYPDEQQLQIYKDKLVMQRIIEKEAKLAKKKLKLTVNHKDSQQTESVAISSKKDTQNAFKVPMKREANALKSEGKPEVKKAKNIQSDPTKSNVYKNLFTTSAQAKKHRVNKANWVTFNPQYF